jgi:hypothetical protein
MTRRHSDVDTDDDDDPIDRGYGLGFWDMPPGHPVLLGSDSGASFKSLHCPERALTFTVISNCTNQAWAITSVLNTRFGT